MKTNQFTLTDGPVFQTHWLEVGGSWASIDVVNLDAWWIVGTLKLGTLDHPVLDADILCR